MKRNWPKLILQNIQSVYSFLLFLLISITACHSNDNAQKNKGEESVIPSEKVDAILASLGKDIPQVYIDNYKVAKSDYENNKNDLEAIIWYGRRTAYLGKFQEAIDVYSEGIKKHPKSARLYRHRGHRYISTRAYDEAIEDFEHAVTLIKNKKDQVEQDGLPNKRNIPISTLHGNIWYHLGLAYYLKNDMKNALKAYQNRTVTQKYDDNIVSGGHWLYMIQRRLGNENLANEAIQTVHPEMDIIENHSYYEMCLFYKKLLSEKTLKLAGNNSSSNDVLSYGLGNWYLYDQKDTLKAKQHFQHLLENGNKYSFAYLAAESDWNRLFK